MKLIATALALTLALLLTGCVNRDRREETVQDNTVVTQDGVTEDRVDNGYTTDVTDPADNAHYEAGANGGVEQETVTGNTVTDNDRVNNNDRVNDDNDSVMDNVTDAADDVVDTTGDVARRVVDGAEDVADDVIDGVDRAADNVEDSVTRNR